MDTTNFLNLAGYIDHTLLKPDATSAQIKTLCDEAILHKFKGVCVNSHYVKLVNTLLAGSGPLTVSVIGFPLGVCLTEVKRVEAMLAVENGAQEIDMVINLGALKDQQWGFVEQDIRAVTNCVSVPVKVILETGLLSLDQIARASQCAEAAGARFVKTCTGFSTGGASVEHVKLMRGSVTSAVEVKASGGIKTIEQAMALIEAGATRLGTSSGVQLVTGQNVAPHAY